MNFLPLLKVGSNEKDELFQYHYKNHLFEVLHFVIPGRQCLISLSDHQQVLLIC